MTFKQVNERTPRNRRKRHGQRAHGKQTRREQCRDRRLRVDNCLETRMIIRCQSKKLVIIRIIIIIFHMARHIGRLTLTIFIINNNIVPWYRLRARSQRASIQQCIVDNTTRHSHCATLTNRLHWNKLSKR